MNTFDAEVIIAGAGPTGLALANELGLAGVRVIVLERLAERGIQSRALNLQPRTAELLDARGWLEPIADQAVTNIPGGHFSGIRLDYEVFGTRFPYQVGIPQARVEGYLEAHLAEFGIPVLRGSELTGFIQDDDGVGVVVKGPDGERTLRAAYLIGADGGRSFVRKELGVAFPGRDGRVSMVVADVLLDDDPALPTQWRLPNFNLDRGGGIGFVIPLGDGVFRILFGGPEQQGLGRDEPVTEAEVRVALQRRETALTLRSIRSASRFADAARQAEAYRTGRVLLAGDAAHVHLPAGGQGLNLGVQDAFNLGWKLAATIGGWAPDGLLDTYHSERHPVGARVLHNTRAQGVLMSPDEDVRALRAIVADLIATPDGNRHIAGMISGLDITYDMPGSPPHALLGARLDIELRAGRGVLLYPRTEPELAKLADRWSGRVEHRESGEADAILVRPDGYVCFAGSPDPESVESALIRWFGASDAGS
ncbi:FAD-dependent monooxygenase [Nocardia sp. NPDC051030]|uniref:FAD-dependent monooxygenase n=1 Tax=Nocardia sp. NPDC051030 TaxID=3155162 RepID=UPI00343DF260